MIYTVSCNHREPNQLQFSPSLQGGCRVSHSARLTVQSTDKTKQVLNAFDLGELPLFLCLIITGTSAKENLPVHSPIVPQSQCPPAPIQLGAEATLSSSQIHFICFLNFSLFFVGLERGIDCVIRETKLWGAEEAAEQQWGLSGSITCPDLNRHHAVQALAISS